MRRMVSILALLIALILVCPCAPAESSEASKAQAKSSKEGGAEGSPYWPESVSEEALHSAQWRMGSAGTGAPGLDSLSVLSVSPSGQYIAAANRITVNPKTRNAADVANPMGRLPDALYLYKRQGEGYQPYQTFPIDTEAQLELSSMLGGGSAFAWSEDEARVAIAGGWGVDSDIMAYAAKYHSNLYLLELADGTFRRLTQNSRPCEHCVLPRWEGSDAVRFVRISSDGDWHNALCEIQAETGAEEKLADLFNDGGRVTTLLSWQTLGEKIYYSVSSISDQGGFYVSPFGGAEGDARCLVNVASELVGTSRHPYCRSMGFYRVELSADGRWACLSVADQRVTNRDIPLADAAENPQSDPSNAVSTKTGRPWVPCHNVFLYDLQAERLVDPFVDAALAPTKVIVSAACFAPDGQSLLCAVFGDGGPWTLADFTRTTFYQINLADGSFTPVRVLETELSSSLWLWSGFDWLSDNTLCIPTGMPPTYAVQLLRPAAFLQYPEASAKGD